MSKTITLTLPDGYEDATEIVVLAPGDGPHDCERYATVLRRSGQRIERSSAFDSETEIGGGTIRQAMLLAADEIRGR